MNITELRYLVAIRKWGSVRRQNSCMRRSPM